MTHERRSLTGRSAIVTGSTSGIGLGIARALAAAGSNVMLNGFGDKGEIASLCAEIRSSHAVAVTISGADIASPVEVREMVAQATRELGAVDILVVLTPLGQQQIDDRAAAARITTAQARVELLSEKQPSHEFATPEQIGALATFLCSGDAAQIRGATLTVDGGWTAQ